MELDPSLVADELANLIEEDKVQNVETKIFENSLFFAEEGIKNNLIRLLEKESKTALTQITLLRLSSMWRRTPASPMTVSKKNPSVRLSIRRSLS